MKPSVIDLFSGAGGMSRGLMDAGFEIVAAFDNWEPAARSYALNFEHPIFSRDVAHITAQSLEDLSGIAIGSLDLLVGGPPCQGFSIQRIGKDTDARNDLVLQFARLVVDFRPRFFLMENVPGLLGRRGAEVVRNFTAALESAGYGVLITRIDAAEFGVAQHRKRVLVYGWRSDQLPIQPFTHSTELMTVGQALVDLPEPSPPGTINRLDPLHVESRLSDLNRERLRHIPPGGGFEDLPLELRVNAHRHGAAVIGHRAVYGRLDASRPAGVITARFDSFTRGRFAHPTRDRNITLREGARLQSFPDDFIFVGNREDIAAQIGNAFPPLVGRSVGQHLLRHLKRTEVAIAAGPRQGAVLA